MCCGKSDQDFLRFLWYKDNDFSKPIVTNKMTRLSFGLLPAQSAALYCLEKAIFDNVTKASMNTIMTALKRFYVDGGLFSFPCETEHISFFEPSLPLLASRCFPLTKFFATCDKFKKMVPKDDLLSVNTLEFKDETCFRNTLGMTWNLQRECFQFN